jgi:hypothetical protein
VLPPMPNNVATNIMSNLVEIVCDLMFSMLSKVLLVVSLSVRCELSDKAARSFKVEISLVMIINDYNSIRMHPTFVK